MPASWCLAMVALSARSSTATSRVTCHSVQAALAPHRPAVPRPAIDLHGQTDRASVEVGSVRLAEFPVVLDGHATDDVKLVEK